jgi:F-type H+-transporting ATPase subunit gamma
MQITFCDENGFCSKAKESTRCDYSHASLCRKINGTITKPFCTLEGDVGGEYTTQREVKKVLVVAITSGGCVVHLIQM